MPLSIPGIGARMLVLDSEDLHLNTLFPWRSTNPVSLSFLSCTVGTVSALLLSIRDREMDHGSSGARERVEAITKITKQMGDKLV